MESDRGPKIQIEMKLDSIIVRTEAYRGVLTVTKFEGNDCYPKFLQHMKNVYFIKNLVADLNLTD